jgi:hypothetical protein
MRLVSAEFLKLRKRTGLVLVALGLTVVPAVIMLAVTGGGDFETGGMRSFTDQIDVIAMLSLVGGVLVGATVGTADVSSGVFRDLAVTGRSRLDLYAARVPAGLALVLAAAAAGFAILALSASLSAGSVPTQVVPGGKLMGTIAPSTDMLVSSALWLALVTAVGFVLAFGVASVVGAPGGSIAILLSLWLVVTPLVQSFDPNGWFLQVLVISGLDHVMPADIRGGDPMVQMSLSAAVAVLLAWTALPVLAGAWRTMTRDA